MESSELHEAIQEHAEHIYKIALFFVKDPVVATEIMKQVYSEILKTNTYEKQSNKRNYLTKLTANRAKESLSRLRIFNRNESKGNNLKGILSFGEQYEDLKERYKLGDAILQLPLKYREPIIYYYYEEWPINEIANHMKMPVNSIRINLQTAKSILRESLTEEWEVLKDESLED